MHFWCGHFLLAIDDTNFVCFKTDAIAYIRLAKLTKNQIKSCFCRYGRHSIVKCKNPLIWEWYLREITRTSDFYSSRFYFFSSQNRNNPDKKTAKQARETTKSMKIASVLLFKLQTWIVISKAFHVLGKRTFYFLLIAACCCLSL